VQSVWRWRGRSANDYGNSVMGRAVSARRCQTRSIMQALLIDILAGLT